MLTVLLLQAGTHTITVIKETIPLTFYIPVLVSILTAAVAAYATIRNTRVTTQTQREMAKLADQTAKEFKEKDYKNDFYKKIIDRRLLAWEHAERFIELISVSRNVNGTGLMF
jgi:HD superfamily phosphodiesterase